MQKAKKLQKQHEKDICDIFIQLYESKHKFYRYGNDIDEPDCIYKDGQDVLGIEVTTAYYRDIDAKQLWTAARGDREPPAIEPSWGGAMKNPDDMMCERIQRGINDKCGKTYKNTSKVILLIEENAPLSDEKSIKNCLSNLVVPEQHTFSEIYLLHSSPMHEGGGYKIHKIS